MNAGRTLTRFNHATTRIALLVATLGVLSCKGDTTGPETIDAPTGVSASMISPTSARITWTESTSADRIKSYNIIRNGTKIGEATTASYTDDGLAELTVYKYAVSANGVSGIVSAVSADNASASVTPPDVTSPRVVSWTPSAGAAGVASSSRVAVTFSEDVDASTVNTTTFAVKTAQGVVIPGTVTYTAADRTAAFTPTSAFASNGGIAVTVSGVRDVAGNSLNPVFTLAFTIRDEAPPSITSVTPAAGVTGIAVNTSVAVAFNRAMNASSINSSTITLTPLGGTAVSASVSYNAGNNTATVTPSSPLAFVTLYTITVTTGVQGSNGVALPATLTFSFTTQSEPDTSPPTVIASNPVNGTGNIATDNSISIAFNEAMSPSTVNSSTFSVAVQGGSAIAGSVSYDAVAFRATFTPAAALQNSTTYVITATSGMTDIVGNPLTPYTSTFTTVPAADVTPPAVSSINPVDGTGGVAISTAPTVTFNRSMNASSVNASNILLTPSGGASVPTSVTFNASTNTATISPSSQLAYGTTYTVTVTTGVRGSNGIALPATVTSTFTTSNAPDTSRPTVVASYPPGGADNIATSTAISISFSEAMNSSTVSTSTFTVSVLGGGAIAGSVSYDAPNLRAIFIPASALQTSTTYVISASAGMADVSGNALVPFSSAFTTSPPPNSNGPVVVGFNPLNGDTFVPGSVDPVATFNMAMDESTLNSTTVTLTPRGGSPVNGFVSYNAATFAVTFYPMFPIPPSTTYDFTITTGAHGANGFGLQTTSTTTFTTATPVAGQPPYVTRTNPDGGATGISVNTKFSVTFSTDMEPSSINSNTITLSDGTSPVAGTVAYDVATRVATFTPNAPLAPGVTYNGMIGGAVRDLAGRVMFFNTSSSFRTASPNDVPFNISGKPSFFGVTIDGNIQIRIMFAQNGTDVTLGNCGNGDCIMGPLNQAGADVVGPNTAGQTWATIISGSGTLVGNQFTFTWKMDNGRTFSFKGQVGSNTVIGGRITGATYLAGDGAIQIER